MTDEERAVLIDALDHYLAKPGLDLPNEFNRLMACRRRDVALGLRHRLTVGESLERSQGWAS